MPGDGPRQHAPSPSAAKAPPLPEPSYAERARTLVHLGRVGSLSSMSKKRPGYPFGSVMPYGLDEAGRPVFLISSMAMHTQNLLADGRASLLVTEAAAASDPLGAGRVTLLGEVTKADKDDVPRLRELYLSRYENASYWVDFSDFAFFRMEVADVYFVGGFGVMGWVSAHEYLNAEVDPLADVAEGILQHMNADHADALILLANAHTEHVAEEATMTAVDRLGFHVRLRAEDGWHGARIAFPREVRGTEEARRVLVEMVRAARG